MFSQLFLFKYFPSWNKINKLTRCHLMNISFDSTKTNTYFDTYREISSREMCTNLYTKSFKSFPQGNILY